MIETTVNAPRTFADKPIGQLTVSQIVGLLSQEGERQASKTRAALVAAGIDKATVEIECASIREGIMTTAALAECAIRLRFLCEAISLASSGELSPDQVAEHPPRSVVESGQWVLGVGDVEKS